VLLLPIPLAPRVAARALSGNSARPGRATRLVLLLPIPLVPRVAARALSGNSATWPRGTTGVVAEISDAAGRAARALKGGCSQDWLPHERPDRQATRSPAPQAPEMPHLKCLT
jgi:hypothetical protein